MAAWIMATVLPPVVLPGAAVQRATGATGTSFRKPNSRSRTMEMPENTAVKSTDIPMMPGYMS